MDILFNIEYKTVFGEELLLNVLPQEGNNGDCASVLRMNTVDGVHWQCRLIAKGVKHANYIDYYYSVDCESSVERHEWLVEPHRLKLGSEKTKRMTVYDRWIDIPCDSYLYSSAFTECLNKRTMSTVPQQFFTHAVTLKVRAPQLHSNHRLALIGGTKTLGGWRADKALPMQELSPNEWSVTVDALAFEHGKDESPIEFKFIALDEEGGSLWETGYNRTIELPDMSAGEEVVYELEQSFFPICNTKVAGTLVPLFSLRTKGSFGVGDIGDLITMIDYVAATRQRVLQLLPINDTVQTRTWTDSYPYSCISIFAIHPMYVDLRQLPKLKNEAARNRFEKLRKGLNALQQIDYERVNNAKEECLHLLYAQEGKLTLSKPAYKAFVKENNSWLIPYAYYCFLRDKHGTADFTQWPDHNTWDESLRDKLSDSRTAEYADIAYYLFVQYLLSVQMTKAHDYARSKGVILKGDIPIGVNRHGCDVWTEPRYFNLDSQAGAPPDAFSTNGQNWEFPTYNWDAMLADGCLWWKRRFKNMSRYFDAYRIDHVLGFFRIWDIPINSVLGLMGQFSPALGMTRQEIEAYGFEFNEAVYTNPFISDWVVDRVFGPHANYVRDNFLVHSHDDIYDLKPEFDTQRKIDAAFNGKTSDIDKWIRDGLFSLVDDVLFVRDRNDRNKFHPRIAAQFCFMYEALWDKDKATFNKIYNDYYYHRHNQFWYREAMKKLPSLVQATHMLVCAEDLGMVPDCVAWVMDELRILSLEIQSMPKDPAVNFGNLSRNPYRSVCTISTHDMPTLRQWWDEDEGRTQNYYNSMLYHDGAAPHPLPWWLAREIVARHLNSPSMLCVLSIQDWLAIDEKLRNCDKDAERINVPANPHHYWRYRMHVNIEDLMNDTDFMNSIRDLVEESGR